LEILDRNKVPAGPIYNVEDMVNDAHFKARGLFETVEINGRPLKIPAIMPKLERTPGSTQWAGPQLGSHNQEVLGGLLGISNDELEKLLQDGVI
jgi:crotonobetainyl-CoA:carnitine CoA-transferase CaiB-like acyl-CoA transferase